MKATRPRIVYLGFEMTNRCTLAPGNPPASYKNEDTIAAWRHKETEKLRETGKMIPFGGAVARVAALDPGGNLKFDSRDRDGLPAVNLCRWLEDNFGNLVGDNVYDPPRALLSCDHGPAIPALVLAGFDVRACLHVACIECAAHAFDSGDDEPPRAGFWYAPSWAPGPGFVDPYLAAVPSSDRGVITRADVFAQLGVSSDGTAEDEARAARALAGRLGLL